MIKKKVKIIEVLDNTVIYEVTIVTEEVVTFAESVSAISEKYSDSLGNMRIQKSSVLATDNELSEVEADTTSPADVKERVKNKLLNLKHSFSRSIENLEQDVNIYTEVLNAYNTKKKA